MKAQVICLLALFSMVVANHHHHEKSHPFPRSDESQSEETQPWNNPERQANSKWSNSNSDENYSEHTLIDVLPFRTKITRRIENSEKLCNEPEIKEKVEKLVEDKLYICKTPGASKNKVDRHCIGRVTGEIMQLIAAIENGSRNLPSQYNW